jgi:methylase of polypeptide subunit release factors
LPTTSCIIVANLPYIPEQLFEDNVEDNVKLREPKPAFVGGEDGLDWYREMLGQIMVIRKRKSETGTDYLLPDTGYLCLFLEMMTRQVEILVREFNEHFSFEEVATFHMNIRIVKCMFHN